MKPVKYDPQYWLPFASPPPTYDDMGPSNVNIWIYYPHDGSMLRWANWSGDSKDIKTLKKRKALWCYQMCPMEPKL